MAAGPSEVIEEDAVPVADPTDEQSAPTTDTESEPTTTEVDRALGTAPPTTVTTRRRASAAAVTTDPPRSTTTTARPKSSPTTSTTRPKATTTTKPRATTTTAPRSSEQGEASWYDTTAGTCAHKTIPFGTIVTVTNTANGKRTTCRVADRGPFVSGRIIDLERGVFAQVAVVSEGVFPARITW